MFSSNTSQVSQDALFIEDLFACHLYTGDDSTSRLIQNNIDLSTKGGLVWLKCRSDAQNHALYDTARGATKRLISNLTNAQDTVSGVSAFNTNGFTMGADLNYLGQTMASWTFREQAKFFDVVTYTGNGSNRTIAHNLGSVPGCIIVKRTDTTGAWQVYHRSLANTEYLVLNTTAAKATGATLWNSTTPTSTEFSLGTDATVNANGATYVAYLFAHDAGGFGLTGTDNVISCGSYTGNGSVTGPSITLGYEPQWVMVKSSTVAGSHWYLMDTMRGMAQTVCNELYANLTAAEITQSKTIIPTATGFDVATTDGYINNNGSTYIYIAIRRGPMKTPTTGTSVFAPVTQSANTTTVTTNFPVDLSISAARNGADLTTVIDRLRGGGSTTNSYWLYTASTSNEGNAVGTAGIGMDNMTSLQNNYWGSVYRANSGNIAYWSFRRAPGFFDIAAYTGTGSARTVSHNLGVVPELMIVKRRSVADNWFVYSQTLGNTKHIALDGSGGASGNNIAYWNNTSPTASVFSVGTDSAVNASASTYVNYLFATVAGVSKVGSYTGTGTTLQVNCGFTAGARFVLIKRTDSTGDWYVWDSARGIVAGNDPYLLINSTAAEVTSTDYIDTYSAGFEISSTAPAAINANGGSFVFLAIA